MNQVILLDGNQRSSLAAVRSLGQKGIAVCVGDEAGPSLAGSSRYCAESFEYPSPATEPGAFLSRVEQVAEKNQGAMLLPMTDITMAEILQNHERFSEHVTIPFSGYEQYSALSDKERLFREALALGIAVPDTVFSTDMNLSEQDSSADVLSGWRFSYPAVVKPAVSRIRTGQGWISAGVSYARSRKQLLATLSTGVRGGERFLVQEKIEGPGVGIFLLLSEGKVLARFAHQRVREKPPSGGVSVVCRSIAPPADALSAAEALLGRAPWSGVAMVEFKHDVQDNQCKLMEVNARFWGSLQLAVSAGVDFPYLLYCMATGEPVPAPSSYRTGLFSRWELGDLDHLLIRMKNGKADLILPKGAPSRCGALSRFVFDFFSPEFRLEVFRRDDPGPFFCELRQYAKTNFMN